MFPTDPEKMQEDKKNITCVIFDKCIQTLNTSSNLPILTTYQAISLQKAKENAKQITMTYENKFSTSLNCIHKTSVLIPCCRGHYRSKITDQQCGHLCGIILYN